VKEIEATGCIDTVRASGRARRALLCIREITDGIKKKPHPEEAAKRAASKDALPLSSRTSILSHTLFRGVTNNPVGTALGSAVS
jgi:hypothetical protein